MRAASLFCPAGAGLFPGKALASAQLPATLLTARLVSRATFARSAGLRRRLLVAIGAQPIRQDQGRGRTRSHLTHNW